MALIHLTVLPMTDVLRGVAGHLTGIGQRMMDAKLLGQSFAQCTNCLGCALSKMLTLVLGKWLLKLACDAFERADGASCVLGRPSVAYSRADAPTAASCPPNGLLGGSTRCTAALFSSAGAHPRSAGYSSAWPSRSCCVFDTAARRPRLDSPAGGEHARKIEFLGLPNPPRCAARMSRRSRGRYLVEVAESQLG